MEQSYPALFAAGVLMLLARRPLAGSWVALRGRLLRAALAAGRGLARALVVLRRRMLLSCALLSRAALTAAGRGLTCALVLLRGRPLRTCITLAGRGRLAGALSTTLRTAHVRHAERRDGAAVESSAGLQARRRWNAVSARIVRGPSLPSGRPMLNPFSFSTIWIRRICSSVKFTSATLAAPPRLCSAAPPDPTGTVATILRLRSTMMISSRTTKYWCPRHCGLISMSAEGTSTIRTLDGTAVPTLSAKLTLFTRGTFLLARTVCWIRVRCCELSVTLPPAPCVPCCGVWPCRVSLCCELGSPR